ncbi:hypothetical protein AB4089_15625 [Arthrobacter sp. 2MCAF15]|uniref:hypothetical protein n=1 Tax=Arthrobacter sp. 2MCAF15 TaxID=3232984 RepID=UPI003F908080
MAIRDQVQRRYGLDVDNLGADDASVAAALTKTERDRKQAEQELSTGGDENTQAAQLLAEAAREDRGREQDLSEGRGSRHQVRLGRAPAGAGRQSGGRGRP